MSGATREVNKAVQATWRCCGECVWVLRRWVWTRVMPGGSVSVVAVDSWTGERLECCSECRAVFCRLGSGFWNFGFLVPTFAARGNCGATVGVESRLIELILEFWVLV